MPRHVSLSMCIRHLVSARAVWTATLFLFSFLATMIGHADFFADGGIYRLRADTVGFQNAASVESSPGGKVAPPDSFLAAGTGSVFTIIKVNKAINMYVLKFIEVKAPSKDFNIEVGTNGRDDATGWSGLYVGSVPLLKQGEVSQTMTIDIPYLPLEYVEAVCVPVQFASGLLGIPFTLQLLGLDASRAIIWSPLIGAGGELGPFIGISEYPFGNDIYISEVISAGPAFGTNSTTPIDVYTAIGVLFTVPPAQFGVCVGINYLASTFWVSFSTGFPFTK